ncbi:GvpL/GvpF family gas vesicle protein [Candidatus Woesearchaeota archaeon]|nr:GvpL/GvpF family gas vesicle protein [Candidatus Woesearchaeota archaeon]
MDEEIHKDKELYYLYGIVNKPIHGELGSFGINNGVVFAYTYKEISVIFQKDLPMSTGKSIHLERGIEHLYVLQKCMEHFGCVFPFPAEMFIVKETIPSLVEHKYDDVCAWFQEYDRMQQYNVQIIYDAENAEKKKRKMGIKSYTFAQKEKRLEKQEIIEMYQAQIKEELRQITAKIRIMPMEKSLADTQTILDLSCALNKDKEDAFKNMLQEINKIKYLTVKITGPLPLYGFTGK